MSAVPYTCPYGQPRKWTLLGLALTTTKFSAYPATRPKDGIRPKWSIGTFARPPFFHQLTYLISSRVEYLSAY